MRRPAAASLPVSATAPSADRRTLSFKSILYCLILFLIHPGCATSRVATAPPSPEERAAFGTVGVARAKYFPETGVDVYAKGQAAGAAKGALDAFGSVFLEGGKHIPSDPSVGTVYLVFLGAVAVLAMPVGAYIGAGKAMPKEEAAACERLVRETLERTDPQGDLQDELLRAGDEETEWRLIPVDEAGPATADNVATYESLAGKGIGTVLEASLERVALKAVEGGRDPDLVLVMEARTRLVRVEDGKVLRDNRFVHTITSRKFSEWADDSAARLNKGYEDGLRKLALAITYWTFEPRPQAGDADGELNPDTSVSPEKIPE